MAGVKRLKDKRYAADRAYVPEHMTDYVRAVSGAEAYMVGPCIFYEQGGYLAFIGYPLEGTFELEYVKRLVDKAIKELRPCAVSYIAPERMYVRDDAEESGSDEYFRIPAQETSRPPKVDNMVRRADRELTVSVTKKWTDGHQNLLSYFLKSHPLDEAAQSIYVRVSDYVASSPTALLFNGLDPGGIWLLLTWQSLAPGSMSFTCSTSGPQSIRTPAPRTSCFTP